MITKQTEKLRQVMKDLSLSTEVQCALFDEKGRIICEYPRQMVAFCGRVRQLPELKARCFACDRYGFDKAKANQGTCTYTCHMGLTECVAPIIKKGTVIGYLMLGQTVETENIEQIHKAIANFPEEAYRGKLREELKELPHFSRKKLQAIANVAQMCTSYLWLMDLITMRGDPTAFAIEEYITAHLADELSVELICKEFGISKTSLYLLSQEYFGTGITRYIRGRRMEKAMQLLEEKSMPVSNVAQAVGYMDASHFTRVFKQHTGCTPTKWQKT
ncbi:MAG: PocR ligand-binding domain-containing protein [Oscillospiraceae bacterium]|nr:PocR ligand-binding domain-containing protein [Oscillospiraceae bacterium]